jgi:hypothetical protein
MKDYRCPHCQQPIADEEALLCLYCGERLSRPGIFAGDMTWRKIVIGAVALAVLVSFVLFVLR